MFAYATYIFLSPSSAVVETPPLAAYRSARHELEISSKLAVTVESMTFSDRRRSASFDPPSPWLLPILGPSRLTGRPGLGPRIRWRRAEASRARRKWGRRNGAHILAPQRSRSQGSIRACTFTPIPTQDGNNSFINRPMRTRAHWRSAPPARLGH